MLRLSREHRRQAGPECRFCEESAAFPVAGVLIKLTRKYPDMSIETDFKQLRVHLSRIADALEALLAERGYVPDSPTSVEVDDDDKPVQISEEKPKKKTKKKSKKKDKVTTVGKVPTEESSEFTMKDVRGVLKELQQKSNQAAVKSLLKKYGASTLTQVKEKHYADIIADAQEDME
jgi:hypothetical protein